MATYYVATNGNNANDGSSGTPWRTPQYAATQDLQPGDTVIIRDGTYSGTLTISKSGSQAGGYITFKSENKHGAKIAPTGDLGVNLNANWLKLVGLEVYGANMSGIVGTEKHHLWIVNCKSHDNSGAGISLNKGEWYIVEYNEVFGNCNDINARSGISTFHNQLQTSASTPGFRSIIRGNLVYDNYVLVGNHIDANGIIIDDLKSLQTPSMPNYTFPTLIEDNICYGNGGNGILVFQSDYVTVRNNTCFHNSWDISPQKESTWRSEIQNRFADHNIYYNNIAICDPTRSPAGQGGNYTFASLKNAAGYGIDVQWYNNLCWTGTPGQAKMLQFNGAQVPVAGNGNKLGVNPQLVNPAGLDFTPAEGSVCIDAGVSTYGVGTVDYNGDPRVVGGGIDIGAIEYQDAEEPVTHMTPGSLLGAFTVARTAQTSILAVKPDAAFADQAVRNILPAGWAGFKTTPDDEFGPVPKTFDTNTSGFMLAMFSVRKRTE